MNIFKHFNCEQPLIPIPLKKKKARIKSKLELDKQKTNINGWIPPSEQVDNCSFSLGFPKSIKKSPQLEFSFSL